MILKCKIASSSSNKKRLRLAIEIDISEAKAMNFDEKKFFELPLVMQLSVDEAARQQEALLIDQTLRNKVHALIAQYAKSQGYEPEDQKLRLKQDFIEKYKLPFFSFKDCLKQMACDFINWLLGELILIGELRSSLMKCAVDMHHAMAVSVQYEVCIICSKQGEVHHVEAIGMGRNRKTYDDSDHRKIGLCHDHHQEAETIGRATFFKKHGIFLPCK